MQFEAQIERLETVDSTNSEALRRADCGGRGPIWIQARRQTKGRGRRGREWRSEGGDLTATLLLEPTAWKPDATPIEIATLSYVAALSIADAADMLGVSPRPQLKWPNDVLINGAKLSGLLLESQGSALAIGVGVNLTSPPDRFDEQDGPPQALPATSLNAHLIAPVVADQVLEALAQSFAARFEIWRVRGFAGVRRDWLARAARLGQEMVARLPNEALRGRFADLDDEGALMLDTDEGLKRIHAADVYWPASSA